MIPYIDFKTITLFGFNVKVFGLLVLIAFLSGIFVSKRDARNKNLDLNFVDILLPSVIFGGLFLSHAFVVILYDKSFFQNPKFIFNFYASMSSYGGFIGGLVVAYILLKIKKYPIWPYTDNLILALLVGWIFGRLGCTIMHDHPGTLSSFFLAVNYPDGARHDLGLYEFLYTILLNIIVFFVYRKNLKPGTLTFLIAILYTPVRFFLDFLRTADARYFGLTPGQYFSLILLALSLYGWFQLLKSASLDTALKNNQSSQPAV